jgi:dUTP pyrophosphatase
MKIKLIKFGDYYKDPLRKHFDDAGMDVYSPLGFALQPHETFSLPLGIGLDLPNGFCGFVFPRSSLASQGIIAQLSPIDAGYKGEIHAILTNQSDKPYVVKQGDRVGQIVILPVMICDFIEDGKEDVRGEGAFGSTGK